MISYNKGMIKAVLFDFGGVLTEGGKAGSIRGMFAKAYHAPIEQVKLDDSVQAAFRGTITDDAFLATTNRLNAQFPPATAVIFVEDADFFQRSQQVYDLAAQLRSQGVTTGVFSNVFASSADVLRRDGFYDGFSPLFLSCDHGMMKPELPLYKAVVRELNLEPSEVLFIDDKDEFLAPARQVGMHTVLAVSPEQIVHDVTALIAKENQA